MNKLKHIEVELKFPLLNSNALIEFLNLKANAEKEEVQKDTYFTPAHRSFLSANPVSEWLRLRESEKGCSINYKNWHKEANQKSITCDEYESKIENIQALRKLLESLDFKKMISVNKKRKIWNYKGVEIAIDEVEGLGSFIELEAKDFSDIEEAKKQLYSILKEINAEVGEQDFEGYPYLLLKKKGLL